MDKKILQNYLKELHLPTIIECYQEVAIQATNESLTYEQFLLEVIEKECITRRNRKIQRLLKQSKLPLEKNMINFQMKRLPLKLKQQVKSLLEGGFIERAENVLVFGNSGSGKTHLITGLAQELIMQGHSFYFSPACLLVQELLIAKRDLKLAKYLKMLSNYEVIIIDDLGYVQHTSEEMEVLFTLFAERYERGSVIITSNLPFSQWDKIFKNKAITIASTDRLIHHSLILEMNLPSYRIEHAKNEREVVTQS